MSNVEIEVERDSKAKRVDVTIIQTSVGISLDVDSSIEHAKKVLETVLPMIVDEDVKKRVGKAFDILDDDFSDIFDEDIEDVTKDRDELLKIARGLWQRRGSAFDDAPTVQELGERLQVLRKKLDE